MKTFFIVVSVFLLLVCTIFGIKIIFFPVNTAMQSVDMAYGVVDKTLDSDNAIYNYEWFKRQETSIKALYSKEERANEDLKEFKSNFPEKRSDWSREDKNEYDRLNTIATGLGNQIDDAIAEYNARSSMANRKIFKDNLPSNLTRAYLAGLELTK